MEEENRISALGADGAKEYVARGRIQHPLTLEQMFFWVSCPSEGQRSQIEKGVEATAGRLDRQRLGPGKGAGD